MRARVEYDFAGQRAKVWLIGSAANPASDSVIVHRLIGNDEWVNEEVKPGALLPEPSFILPRDALQALVREASSVLPVEDATNAHLQDTIRVRDRLLTLVVRDG